MIGRNIESLSNSQLEHLQLMKGTIIDVTTVIKTTGMMNANNVVIQRQERERLKDTVLSV